VRCPVQQWKKQVLKIFGPESIRINLLIKTTQSTVSKKCAKHNLFCQRQPRNYEKLTLVARRRERFRVFWPFFWLLNSLQKRCFSTQEFNRFLSMVSSQRRATRSDVFFQTKLSEWLVTVELTPPLFLINRFGTDMVLCSLYLKRFDLTKGLLFDTFVVTVWYKLCRCDHTVLEFKSFSPLMKSWTEWKNSNEKYLRRIKKKISSFYGKKHRIQGQIFMKQNAPQSRLIKQNAPQVGFLD